MIDMILYQSRFKYTINTWNNDNLYNHQDLNLNIIILKILYKYFIKITNLFVNLV